MWLSLAASLGHENATLVRVKLKRRMTPEQIDDGYEMMREWRRYFPSGAGKSSAARLNERASETQKLHPLAPVDRNETAEEKATTAANRISRLL